MNLCACRGCLEFAHIPYYDTAGCRRGFVCAMHVLKHLAGQQLVDGEGTPIVEIGYQPGRRTWVERMRATKRALECSSAQAASKAAENESWVERMRAVKRAAKSGSTRRDDKQ